MATDFRIEVGFVNHRKTRRLIAAGGMDAFFSLVSLWDYATVNRKEGILFNMDAHDIEAEAQWRGQPGKFVELLSDEKIRFLERDNDLGCYILHDWKDHQPWVVASDARRERAYKGAAKRWGHVSQKPTKNTPSMENDASSIHKNASSNAPSLPPSFLPSLSPPTPPCGGVKNSIDEFCKTVDLKFYLAPMLPGKPWLTEDILREELAECRQKAGDRKITLLGDFTAFWQAWIKNIGRPAPRKRAGEEPADGHPTSGTRRKPGGGNYHGLEKKNYREGL